MPMLRSQADNPKDSDGFSEECISHLDALYGVACRLTRNPTEAEDLVQDALVKAMRARHASVRAAGESCPARMRTRASVAVRSAGSMGNLRLRAAWEGRRKLRALQTARQIHARPA